MKELLWYLIAGTRGGPTRAHLIAAIRDRPRNANQLATDCMLDYKTVQHHLRILLKHQLLTVVDKDAYGAVYFLSDAMKAHLADFGSIWKQFGNS